RRVGSTASGQELDQPFLTPFGCEGTWGEVRRGLFPLVERNPGGFEPDGGALQMAPGVELSLRVAGCVAIAALSYLVYQVGPAFEGLIVLDAALGLSRGRRTPINGHHRD